MPAHIKNPQNYILVASFILIIISLSTIITKPDKSYEKQKIVACVDVQERITKGLAVWNSDVGNLNQMIPSVVSCEDLIK